MDPQSSIDNTCTGCGQHRPIESFLKNGKIQKTCLSCRDKKNRQNAQKHTAADALADASINRITIEDFFRILKAIKGQTIEDLKQIVDIGGYTAPIDPKKTVLHGNRIILQSLYHCAQLLDRQKKSKKHEDPTKHRDRLLMQWFHCRSWLMLTIDLQKFQVTIELTHEYHAEYVDVRVINEIKEYIQTNLQQTPRNIWENLDKNQIQSAIKIIEQYDDIEILLSVEDSGVTMISFGVREIINQLGVNAVEIGVDATYNTNKMNLELYLVLAEVDRMEFPLAYMLLTTANAIIDGIHTKMITHFFDKLYHIGINPTFVITDKDSAQISAVKMIWPDAYIQLCLWHLKRAIKRQLGLKKKPKTTRYHGNSANAEFPFININFCPDFTSQQSTVLENFDLNNKNNNTNMPQSKKITFTFCPPEHYNHIINLVTKHFNQHPYIPADDMQYYSPNQIHEVAIREIYTYCKDNDLKWVWSYLWVEWYSSLKWSTWVQSAKKEISVLKTTMIMESHWRLIKHNYINKFNKPHVDLLVWILVEPLGGNSYATDPKTWTCSCLAYLDSCFLLCKHLVQSVCPIKPNLFNEVKCYRSPPFWRHKDLIPLVQGLGPVEEDETYELEDELNTNMSVKNEEFNNETNKDLVEQLNNETDDELVEALQEYEGENDYFFEEFSETWEEVSNCVTEKLQKWTDLFKSQEQYKDPRFLLVAEEAINGIEKMLAKCEVLKNRKKLPRMWKD
ncbi:20949_t:CDS:2, partial [Gigaspora margarita]